MRRPTPTTPPHSRLPIPINTLIPNARKHPRSVRMGHPRALHPVTNRNRHIRPPSCELQHRDPLARSRIRKPRQPKRLLQSIPKQRLPELCQKCLLEFVRLQSGPRSRDERELIGIQLALDIRPRLGHEARLEDRIQRRGEPGSGDVLVLDELLAGLEGEVAVREREAEFVVYGVLLEDRPIQVEGGVRDGFGFGGKMRWEGKIT